MFTFQGIEYTDPYRGYWTDEILLNDEAGTPTGEYEIRKIGSKDVLFKIKVPKLERGIYPKDYLMKEIDKYLQKKNSEKDIGKSKIDLYINSLRRMINHEEDAEAFQQDGLDWIVRDLSKDPDLKKQASEKFGIDINNLTKLSQHIFEMIGESNMKYNYTVEKRISLGMPSKTESLSDRLLKGESLKDIIKKDITEWISKEDKLEIVKKVIKAIKFLDLKFKTEHYDVSKSTGPVPFEVAFEGSGDEWNLTIDWSGNYALDARKDIKEKIIPILKHYKLGDSEE